MPADVAKGDIVWVHAGDTAIQKVVFGTYPGGFKFYHPGGGRLLDMPLDAEGEFWCRDEPEDVAAFRVVIALRPSF